jgi:hypothetical protein
VLGRDVGADLLGDRKGVQVAPDDLPERESSSVLVSIQLRRNQVVK